MGVSKQSVHQAKQRQLAFDRELDLLVILADELKEEHPGCGVEKMYYTLQPQFIGRDKFCEIFLSLGYGVKRMRNYTKTTVQGTIHYSNLIEGVIVTRPFQVIQSDITYFRLNDVHYYMVFIIDVYTRLIVGYNVGNHLRAEANARALKMALDRMDYSPWELIHHSDKGSQYSSRLYEDMLENAGIHPSMGNTAWENPYAERINGIIKNEFLKHWEIKDLKQLCKKTDQAVHYYNSKRKHRAFKMRYTPEEFYHKQLTLDQESRPKVRIYANDKPMSALNPDTKVLNPHKGAGGIYCPWKIDEC